MQFLQVELPYPQVLYDMYFSSIDELWNFERKSFLVHQLFVRTHHVSDTKHQYEKTVNAAAIENGKIADDSSRKTPSTAGLKIDIFGRPYETAHSAHLLPHAPSCAPYWFPVVPWVLSTVNHSRTWNFLQKCIHGTKVLNKTQSEEMVSSNIASRVKDSRVASSNERGKKSSNTVNGLKERKAESSNKRQRTTPNEASGSQLSGSSRKIPLIGIKHFLTNRIRLVAQDTYLDLHPCVIIVPIMQSVEAVRNWSGTAYDAIVLAGNWMHITAAEVYSSIQAGIRQDDHSTNCIANRAECNLARILLEEMILSVCHVAYDKFNVTRRNLRKNDHWNNWKEAVQNNPQQEAPVPTDNWNTTMKIRKIFICFI